MPWSVSGIAVAVAALVPRLDERAAYGGTPTDAPVIEAIRDIRAAAR